MKKLIAIPAIVAALLAGSSATANATEVCPYLDNNPTIAGVEDLVGIAVSINGWDAYYAGGFIAGQVATYCPRHFPTLQAFVAKWDDDGPGFIA